MPEPVSASPALEAGRGSEGRGGAAAGISRGGGGGAGAGVAAIFFFFGGGAAAPSNFFGMVCCLFFTVSGGTRGRPMMEEGTGTSAAVGAHGMASAAVGAHGMASAAVGTTTFPCRRRRRLLLCHRGGMLESSVEEVEAIFGGAVARACNRRWDSGWAVEAGNVVPTPARGLGPVLGWCGSSQLFGREGEFFGTSQFFWGTYRGTGDGLDGYNSHKWQFFGN